MSSERSWDLRVIEWLLAGFFLFLPISIAVAEPLVFLCIPFWIYRLIAQPRMKETFRCPYFVPVIVFVLIALFCSVLGVRPDISLPKCHRLLLLTVIFTMDDVLADSVSLALKRVEKAVGLFIAGASLMAVYDLIRVPILVARGIDLYDTGNMRDPQIYMVSLCFLLSWLIIARGKRRQWLWISALLLSAAGMIVHFKRGVWLAFVGAAGMIGALAKKWKSLAVTLLCALALLIFPQVRGRLVLLRDVFSLEQGGRYVLWRRVAPALLREYPMGMGLCSTQHEDFTEHAEYIQPGLNHLHNNILQIALETGIAGMLVWLGWMATAVVVMYRVLRRTEKNDVEANWIASGVLGGFIGLMLNGMVEYNFGDSEILMLLCFLMGLSCVLWRRTRILRGADSTVPRRSPDATVSGGAG